MSESQDNKNRVELRRIRRMLHQTSEMARHATMTGSMEGGARTSALQYNRVLEYLEQRDTIPTGFFERLSEEANFGEIGVAAAQLEGYLQEDEPEEDRAPGQHGGHGPWHGPKVINVGMGGMQELKELKELGQMIRDHLPEWLRGDIVPGVPNPQTQNVSQNIGDTESRLAEVGAQLQAVAEQLRRGDLSSDQRSQLADKLSRLGQEQAQLARANAAQRVTMIRDQTSQG